MENKGTFVTKRGLKKLEDELLELKNIRRREIAERINQAKELGDLSENAEYVEAKTEQAFIEGRIIELDDMIRHAIVIDESKRSDVVVIGSTVKVASRERAMEFSIVGSNEADPAHGKISNESPLGSAFLGHREGDTVPVQTPSGTVDYTLQSIS